MNADSFLAIGKTHHICQDYVRVHDPEGKAKPFCLLSDGCSASPDTDIGARFLVLAAERERLHRGWFFNDDLLPGSAGHDITASESCLIVLDNAMDLVQDARLSLLCLDATLLSLVPDDKYILASIIGDGVIAARRRDGTIESWVVDFPEGAPGYLSYLIDDKRLKHFCDKYGAKTVKHMLGGKVLHDVEARMTYEAPPPDETKGTASGVSFDVCLDPAEYDFVAIFSDGIQSFVRETKPKNFEAVPLDEVLAQVMAIKGSAGEFVTRRCRRFQKFCLENKWQHNDDFSMAAIWCGSQE